jgi:hypothetical protein
MNPKINMFDLRLLEGSLSADVFKISKFAYFDENVERVRVKSVTVYILYNLEGWRKWGGVRGGGGG